MLFNLLKNMQLNPSRYYVRLLGFKNCILLRLCPEFIYSKMPIFQIRNVSNIEVRYVPNFEVGNVPNFEVGNVPNFKLGNCIQSIITRAGGWVDGWKLRF